MLTVDLFSVYFLSCIDIVIRYFEVDLTFELLDYVRYIEEVVISRFHYVEVLFDTFYCNFGRDVKSCVLYRGLH